MNDFVEQRKIQTYGVNPLEDLDRKVLARNESGTRGGGTDGLGLDSGEERGEEEKELHFWAAHELSEPTGLCTCRYPARYGSIRALWWSSMKLRLDNSPRMHRPGTTA